MEKYFWPPCGVATCPLPISVISPEISSWLISTRSISLPIFGFEGNQRRVTPIRVPLGNEVYLLVTLTYNVVDQLISRFFALSMIDTLIVAKSPSNLIHSHRKNPSPLPSKIRKVPFRKSMEYVSKAYSTNTPSLNQIGYAVAKAQGEFEKTKIPSSKRQRSFNNFL